MEKNNTIDFKLINVVLVSGVCSTELNTTNDEGIIWFELCLKKQIPTIKEDKKKTSYIKVFCENSAKDAALSSVKVGYPIFVRGHIFSSSYAGVKVVSVYARQVFPIYEETDFDTLEKCLKIVHPTKENKNAI